MLHKFNSLVDTFSEENNLAKNKIDDNVILLYIENFPLTIFFNNNFITLQSGVALVPDSRKEDFFKKLLILNNNIIETSGTSFGFDTESDMVTLQFSCSITNITQEEFDALLFNFIIILSNFMKKISYNDLMEEQYSNIDITNELRI
ncbi:MAG: type III secretion system chaperone [Desulfovibrionaceae bacterium]|nr:type III secretion system chaperone [Desulfovibrionaceae bacterium]